MEPASICEDLAVMHRAMPAFAPSPAVRAAPRTELVLRDPDGRPWTLSFSAGCEIFIGRYPRLTGIDGGAPLLSFAAAVPQRR